MIGVSSVNEREGEAFIQFFDGKTAEVLYYPFPRELFYASNDSFKLNLEGNEFSDVKIKLNLPELKAEIKLEVQDQWPKTLFSPNIMGPLSYWPYLDCNHGVISLRSELNGFIDFRGRRVNLDNGMAYLEKDWGRSFPKAHIWMQASRFCNSKASLSIAIAKMKVAGLPITGFGAILLLDGKHYLFTSYNLSRVNILEAKDDTLEIDFKSSKYHLNVKASAADWMKLKSPNVHGMDGTVQESLKARLSIALFRNQKLIYKDIAINAGLEIEGKWE